MKQPIESYLWSCDFKECRVLTTSREERDTPEGWTSFSGALQNAHGGGPASFDLCPKHSTSFERTYKIHRDIDDEEELH